MTETIDTIHARYGYVFVVATEANYYARRQDYERLLNTWLTNLRDPNPACVLQFDSAHGVVNTVRASAVESIMDYPASAVREIVAEEDAERLRNG